MKKILLLLLFLLAGCAAPPATPVQEVHALPTQDWSGYEPAMDAFQVNDTCPQMCWLGINPGVTTAAEAETLLKASDQVDQTALTVAETGIQAIWFTETTKTLRSNVYVYLEQGLVKSVSFTTLAPVTIGDISNLLGEPQGINISMETQGNVMLMPYGLYYESHKVMAASEAGDPGPHANDSVVSLTMNLGYDSKFFKPWIGYGHLDVYLAGEPVHDHSNGP